MRRKEGGKEGEMEGKEKGKEGGKEGEVQRKVRWKERRFQVLSLYSHMALWVERGHVLKIPSRTKHCVLGGEHVWRRSSCFKSNMVKTR